MYICKDSAAPAHARGFIGLDLGLELDRGGAHIYALASCIVQLSARSDAVVVVEPVL